MDSARVSDSITNGLRIMDIDGKALVISKQPKTFYVWKINLNGATPGKITPSNSMKQGFAFRLSPSLMSDHLNHFTIGAFIYRCLG
jgi:hypothetical protein